MKQTFESYSDSSQNPAHDASRSRLLDAAESLIAEHGIHQASVRGITSLAQANLGAINYHFGSKYGLVAAVLARRVAPVNAERIRILDRLEAESRGAPVPLREILAALWRPTIPVFETHPNFVRFMGRVISEPDPAIRQLLPRQFGILSQRFVAAVRKTLPELTAVEIWSRYHFMIGAMIHTWTNQFDIQAFLGAEVPRPSAQDQVNTLIEFCAAGFLSHRKQGA